MQTLSNLSEWWIRLPTSSLLPQYQSFLKAQSVSKLRLVKRVACLLGILVLTVGCASSPSGVSKDQALQDHVDLGLGYIREGNRQMARQHLQRAMEIDSRSARAHHGMALLLEMEMEYALAEEHYRKAISYDKKYTRARNNYAVFLFNRERNEDAYKEFEKAGEDINYRNRFQVFYSLGVVANRLGKTEEAKAAWEKSLALSPRYAMPQLELAEYYFEKGDVNTARKHLGAFDTLSTPQSRSLWLAVRIEDRLGNKDAVSSKGLALEKLFPNSAEARQYQAWQKNEKN